jgi:hypothetical protein
MSYSPQAAAAALRGLDATLDALAAEPSAVVRELGLAEPAEALGALEATSLLALLNYLAVQRQIAVGVVYRQFFDRFNIGALAALPNGQFDAAVRYLVDQIPPAAKATGLAEANSDGVGMMAAN